MFIKINDTIIKVNDIVSMEMNTIIENIDGTVYITLSNGNELKIKLNNQEHFKQYMELENRLLDM